MVAHLNHVGRVHDLHTLHGKTLRFDDLSDLPLVAGENDFHVIIFFHGHRAALDNLDRRVVAAESVHNDFHLS